MYQLAPLTTLLIRITSEFLLLSKNPLFLSLLHKWRLVIPWTIYNNVDLFGLRDYLLDFDFSPYLKSTEVESTWSSFKCVLTKALDPFTPKKKVPGKNPLCGSILLFDTISIAYTLCIGKQGLFTQGIIVKGLLLKNSYWRIWYSNQDINLNLT